MSPPSVLTAEQGDRAKAIGADTFLRGWRYRRLRDSHVFGALDGCVEAMIGMKFPNPYDGRILGAFATALIRHDPKSLGYLRKRKVLAFVDEARGEREELFVLIGLRIADQYLDARKGLIPKEPLLSRPNGLLDQLEDLFELMRQAGEAMSKESVTDDEIAVTFPDLPSAEQIATALIEEAVGSYEAVIPELGEDEEIPDKVQREAMARAAFLRLGVDDLVELAAIDDMGHRPTKAQLVKALGERYADDLDEVARLTLRRTEGDPEFGLVTRLVKLGQAPDISATTTALTDLRGHYFEARPALFFVFGDVVPSPSGQIVEFAGRIRSFTVSPAVAGGETKLNARPGTQDISVILKSGRLWAEVNARRTTDLSYVRAVLRRTGEIVPSSTIPAPDPLPDAPFNTWDRRTLWILDFLRQDLQASDLKLVDMLVANFISPDAGGTSEASGSTGDEGSQAVPVVDSVELRGQQLHDHPEACARIVGRAHLRDVELRVRRVLDKDKGTSKLVRVRLSWEKDHLAVMSGAHGDEIDPNLHQKLTQLVRDAAGRPLSPALRGTLERIQRRASEVEVDADAESILTATAAVPDAVAAPIP